MPRSDTPRSGPTIRLAPGAALVVGAACAAGSAALRYALTAFLAGEERFVALFPALLLATYLGGWVGGAACLAGSILIDWYLFLGQPGSWVLAPHEAAGLVALFISGAVIVAGVVAMRRLIDSLEAAREAEQLLSRELLHRVKNNLAVVEALAAMSARGTDDLATFLDRFLTRMRSLARAQLLLVRDETKFPTLEAVVSAVLGPFKGRSRLTWSGPPIRLDGQQAVALAMCLHELATNSLKYGALSGDEGAVRISWSDCGRGQAEISWTELGGPAVTEPARAGSGTRLLRRGLESDSPAVLDYRPDGLRWAARFRSRRAADLASLSRAKPPDRQPL